MHQNVKSLPDDGCYMPLVLAIIIQYVGEGRRGSWSQLTPSIDSYQSLGGVSPGPEDVEYEYEYEYNTNTNLLE